MSLTGSTSDGLAWGYYSGYFADNVNFFTGAPVASGVVTGIPSINAGTNGYVPGDSSRDLYSVQWLGYFRSNYTGTWTFYTSSDDASYLWIGPNATSGFAAANSTVNNGGLHGMVEQSGSVSLVAGRYYPIRVQFGENGGGDNMIVSFANPGLTKTTNGQGFFYTAPPTTISSGSQSKIFLGPLFSYPSSSGTLPTSDGMKVSFARASSQYLDFGSQTLDMSQGFSVTCRFAFIGTGVNYERIFDFGKGQGNDNLILCRNAATSQISFYFQNGATQYYVSSTNSVAQGQVNMVTAIYTENPLLMTIVLNGVATTYTPPAGATTPRTLTTCYVGRSNWSTDPYPNIDIYSLSIYNRVLTPNEMSGPPAPMPWSIFTATPNGLTAAQAAVNALALRRGYPGYGDGVYWINCGGVPKQTYCLMDPKWDGGGWMLIMKAAQGATFNWGSTHWTTTSTLNPADTTVTISDAKFDVFNSVPVTDVMAVWPTSDIGAGNQGGSLTVSDGWVWLVKNWYTTAITPLTGFQNDRDAIPADIFSFSGFSTTSPIWSYQSGTRAHVFGSGAHITGSGYYARWGFLWNDQVGTLATEDSIAGIGLSYPSSSGGDFYLWVGTEKKGFNRNIAWLMYGR